jgi:hypothetical protein
VPSASTRRAVGAGSVQVKTGVGTEVGFKAGLDPLEWSFGVVICGSR